MNIEQIESNVTEPDPFTFWYLAVYQYESGREWYCSGNLKRTKEEALDVIKYHTADIMNAKIAEIKLPNTLK